MKKRKERKGTNQRVIEITACEMRIERGNKSINDKNHYVGKERSRIDLMIANIKRKKMQGLLFFTNNTAW